MAHGPFTPLRALGLQMPDGVRRVSEVDGSYHDGVEEPLTRLFSTETDLRSTNTELVAKVDGAAQAFQVDAARANIVRGLDIPTSATVLEIGAGCGAVTRYLGERAAVVDPVEPARLRALTARARDLPWPSSTSGTSTTSWCPTSTFGGARPGGRRRTSGPSAGTRRCSRSARSRGSRYARRSTSRSSASDRGSERTRSRRATAPDALRRGATGSMPDARLASFPKDAL